MCVQCTVPRLACQQTEQTDQDVHLLLIRRDPVVRDRTAPMRIVVQFSWQDVHFALHSLNITIHSEVVAHLISL